MAEMKKIRPIDANAMADQIKRYMRGYRNAPTRLTVCRSILSMLGDEKQTPTIRPESAHIDREAWEPCYSCKKKNCENCKHGYDTTMENEHCTKCMEESEWEAAYGFCPWCGRPMDKEAWAELEKRMRGVTG